MDCSSQKEDTVECKERESHFQTMNLIKSLAKFVLTNGQLNSLTVSRTDDSRNKEKEVLDVGDEDMMYGPLLDDIHTETFMNEDDFELTRDNSKRSKAYSKNISS